MVCGDEDSAHVIVDYFFGTLVGANSGHVIAAPRDATLGVHVIAA